MTTVSNHSCDATRKMAALSSFSMIEFSQFCFAFLKTLLQIQILKWLLVQDRHAVQKDISKIIHFLQHVDKGCNK